MKSNKIDVCDFDLWQEGNKKTFSVDLVKHVWVTPLRCGEPWEDQSRKDRMIQSDNAPSLDFPYPSSLLTLRKLQKEMYVKAIIFKVLSWNLITE